MKNRVLSNLSFVNSLQYAQQHKITFLLLSIVQSQPTHTLSICNQATGFSSMSHQANDRKLWKSNFIQFGKRKTPFFFTITYINCISIYKNIYILFIFNTQIYLYFIYIFIVYQYINIFIHRNTIYICNCKKNGEFFPLPKCMEFDFHSFLSEAWWWKRMCWLWLYYWQE
jgi:hypothetical protein